MGGVTIIATCAIIWDGRIGWQEVAPKVSEIESLRADVKKIQDYLLKQAADEGDRFKDLYLAERKKGNSDTTKGRAL